MLFSEPKIPQSNKDDKYSAYIGGFSALQRAENSSIAARSIRVVGSYKFQCSSASRKFLNYGWTLDNTSDAAVSVLFSEPKIPQLWGVVYDASDPDCFSALQRAENSSMFDDVRKILNNIMKFQCSSASRKFLNRKYRLLPYCAAMFQCSSASRKFLNQPVR